MNDPTVAALNFMLLCTGLMFLTIAFYYIVKAFRGR